MDDYISEVRTFPQDLTAFQPLDIPEDDIEIYESRLIEILEENDTPAARHTILQAAAKVPLDSRWSDIALQWAEEEDGISPGRANIIKFALDGLSTRIFSAERWLKQLGTNTHPHRTLKGILIAWSENDFDTFLDACTTVYHHSTLRIPVATLLIEAILETPYEPSDVSSSTAMARVASSPFIDILLKSLTHDTGNRLFSINLRLLLSVLPYAPLEFTSKVPLMAIILGRAISWRDRPFIDLASTVRDGFTQTPPPNSSLDWEVATSSAEPDIEMPEHLKPRWIAQLYIIALYGAWPSNVIAFVRDPVSYIRGKNVSALYAVDWDKVWPPGVLATRMEPLIRDFRLHPSLVIFTSTAELADDKRWDRIDAAEFIARSQALSNSDQQGAPRAGLFDEDEQSPIEVDQTKHSSRLGKENELLRLEAKFTSRVRKQYLYHIGRLHKTSLRLNNDEAEIHSFVNRLKAQTSQIAELTAQLSQARTDASQAQQKHVKWQGQLRDKVASFREEKGTWQTEAARIRAELSEVYATVKAQREELAEVKNERFKLQNQLTEAEPKIRHIADYETRMKQLTDSQRLWDDDVQRCKEALQEAEAAKAKCHEMLKASRQETLEQAQAIEILERRVPNQKPTIVRSDVGTSGTDVKPVQDVGIYVQLLEQAKARTDKLERENLELRNALLTHQQVDKAVNGDSRNDKSFIFGGDNVV